MKIIYSQLKKLLPDLKKPVRKVADDLTMIGFFANGLEKKEGEEVVELEVRQNRGDALGYYGIAKELSALYNIPLKEEGVKIPPIARKDHLPIKITAKTLVKRVMALKISNLKNSSSPDWLKKFLRLHDTNSINTIVDLTNLAMFWYGIPCHAFDNAKIAKNLIWEINSRPGYPFTSLDGTKVQLPVGTLQVSDSKKVVSLAGIVGSSDSRINLDTQEIIVEMAIYDRGKVRKDSRDLKIITEASTRLDKELDTELIPKAFFHLVRLILDHCQGQITSSLFDNYLEKPKVKRIKFNPQKPSLYAGIPISEKFSLETLGRLGCNISRSGQPPAEYKVAPPTLRKDICLEEDLIEEVIRFYGYDKIPTNQPIPTKKLTDITPKIIYLIETVKNILVKMGYDEVRSWPLIREKDLIKTDNLGKKTNYVYTQNSINSQFPVLRQSIASSLRRQKKQYEKYKLPRPQFFEIGKVFYKQGKKYREHYSLGFYHYSEKQLKIDARVLLKKLGINGKVSITRIGNDSFAQINLKTLSKKKFQIIAPDNIKISQKAVCELTSQIITLDANVIASKKQTPKGLIKKYQKIIGEKHLWQLVITDIYKTDKGDKYTFRASYFNADGQKAKKIHRKAFGL